ncbi:MULTISPECIES: cupin domain-containing protein [Methylorubrum]|jgi:cupin 2 domain-containing protein|nr:cupin domain-containing protein [Methylorubrum populi]KAB7783366.1 hypothetical protein F8B43_4660 [Methylorubrum populi]OAH26798.1 cupin [Methylorubrum populi]PZP68905.1 MAG: cupin domain-containing protein [Methylorubrum populi]
MSDHPNLYAGPPTRTDAEIFETLLTRPGIRVERIVSTGQASPPGFWYDQDGDEWVAVLKGSAELRFADEPAPRRLAEGDHLLIPAHCRHRVERTANPTIWLAVHLAPR